MHKKDFVKGGRSSDCGGKGEWTSSTSNAKGQDSIVHNQHCEERTSTSQLASQMNAAIGDRFWNARGGRVPNRITIGGNQDRRRSGATKSTQQNGMALLNHNSSFFRGSRGAAGLGSLRDAVSEAQRNGGEKHKRHYNGDFVNVDERRSSANVGFKVDSLPIVGTVIPRGSGVGRV